MVDFTGFSQTVWGKGILYGLPMIIVLLMVKHHFYPKRDVTDEPPEQEGG